MIRLVAAAVFLLTFAAARGADSPVNPDAAATIVIYNRNDPSSTALAKYYAERRNIPTEQLLGLACSPEEEISRDEYLASIEKPLQDAFSSHGWWKISLDDAGHRIVQTASMRFVAMMRGVPMKIRANEQKPVSKIYTGIPPGTPLEMLVQHNEASVDSELAALFTLLEDTPAMVGNNYYRRFAHIRDMPPTRGPLLVCRLDASSDATVRRMIDDAIATEKSGLWGWAYLDSRHITSPDYIEGEQWIARAGEMMRRKGIPTITDDEPEILPNGFPVTDAAVYYGWYAGDIAGPFAKPDFKFVRGAIAVHLHSFSARTLRTPGAGWAGPLLEHGAAATMGNVYEPFLSLTINFDLLQDRLMNGFTLAEAAYAATRGLSWMNVVFGDPLYRPYASWNSLGSSDDAQNLWSRYREVVLHANGDPLAAADTLRKLARSAHSSMPLEALGQAQGNAKQFDAAIQTLAAASKIEKSPTIRFRIALEQIELLRRAGRPNDALKQVSDALEDFKTDEQQITLGDIILAIRPPPPPPTPQPNRK